MQYPIASGTKKRMANNKCPMCKRWLPDYIDMAPLMGSISTAPICAVCALRLRNKELGLPRFTPFTGEIASQMYDDTIEHYNKTNQI